MIDSQFLRQLDKFSIIVKKRLTSPFTGERQSRHLGSGLLFRDHANYVPGDDFKHIDWKVFSRTDKLYVKRFEEDRNLTVHVLVDYSGSMNFGKQIKKYEYAAMIGLGFVYLAHKNNEKFVLSTFDGRLDLFKARKGAQQLAEILAYLNKRKPGGTTDIEQALSSYKKFINTKSLVIIVSDFLYDPASLKAILSKLRKNKVKLIQVLDPLEKNLKLEGDYTLMDLESQQNMRTFIDPYLRKTYLQKMQQHQEEILKVCAETGSDFYPVVTDQSIFTTFSKILN